MQNGVSWDDFRKQAKVELAKAMMLNEELRQHVTIPPEQIQAYYDAHHDQFTVKQEKFQLAQILIAVPPNACARRGCGRQSQSRRGAQEGGRGRGLRRARQALLR